jgi:hypothetical protein
VAALGPRRLPADFSRRQPVGWVEAHLTAKGGRFSLHAIGGNRQRTGSTEAFRWRA